MAVFEVQNSNGRFMLRLTVNEDSYSIENNTSTLSYTLQLIANTSYWFSLYSIGRSVTINGSNVYYVSRASAEQFSLPAYGTITLASGSGVTVWHESDGNKTISVAFSIDMASADHTPGPLSGSGSMPLTYIPRASKLWGISNFDVEGSISIPITKYSSGFTDNLTISYGDTTIKTINGISNGATVSFTPTELSTIYNLMSTVNSGTFTFVLNTYNGGTWIGSSSQTATGSIFNAAPTLSASVVDVNSATIALTGNSSKLVKYKSTARVTITSSGKKGASISSKVVNGTAVTGDTLDIANISVTPLTVTVTDSRGNSNTVTLNPTVIPYVPLTISANFYRPAPTTGEVAVKFSGNYFNGSFGAAANTLTLSWKYRPYGAATWTNGGTFTAGRDYTLDGNTFASDEISLGTGYDYESNFEFILYFTDKLVSSDTGAIFVSKGIPVFDWGEKDFEFNVPVSGSASFIASIFLLTHPVGCIYFTDNPTNPGTIYGGTWIAWGVGRVPVGVDASQAEFNAVEKTGGEKTHTLSIEEMPYHTHIQNAHSHTLNTKVLWSNPTSSNTWSTLARSPDSGTTEAKTMDGYGPDAATAVNQYTGGSQAHNNLPPYITCYIWKRTA